MHRLPLIGLAVSLSLLTPVSPARATNDYFLPGDAFFPSRLILKNLKEQEQGAEPVYYYNYVCEYAFCGYAGYSQLKLHKQNSELAKNIRKAYSLIRERQPIRLQRKNNVKFTRPEDLRNLDNYYETNGLSIFFYNADHVWQNWKIAIKYNENWREEMKKFVNTGSYCAFVKTPDALKQSLEQGMNVPPLNVQLPEADIKTGKRIDTPLIPKGPLKALILFDDNYKQYYDMKGGKVLLEVTNKGITAYIIHRRQWKKYNDVYGNKN
ncbi:hypothetical protein Pan153_39780 [Gimesia panareensis]|uniref:Uncharacterized protein n=1 Tax=Gimesia panareensis TaxID=2527978 RepID=A0A518FSL1_9PLAN|nr:hypothetical protein [Gimesia panareensis]QDV19313.1 hypothetical protein Pan153_39780 [Gimesia panareensis]